MRTLNVVTSVVPAADVDVSRITDLALGPDGGLYATTNYDGWVSAWDISGTGLTLIDQDAHRADLSAGATPGLTFVTKDGDPALLTGGFNNGNMILHRLDGDGSFESIVNLGSSTRFAGPFVQPDAVVLNTGDTIVYGGISTGGGIAQLNFDSDGDLTGTDTTASAQVTALTSGTVNGMPYLFTASASTIGVSTWSISPTGALTERGSITPQYGLWVSAPTALADTVIEGTTYLVLAAAGSGSLSVLQVGSDGALGVVDHVLDDRNTRFAGATVVETITHDGLTYVIAGGSDDGISVYVLLPGGRLLPRAHIADSTDATLANINAIAVQSRGAGLDIFAASGTEPGLTRLFYDAGNAQLITGTDDPDTLSGGAGDDIIFDGTGRDTLFGSDGADTFVMARDGETDLIMDFTLGEDSIDLSGWTGLRSVNQLFFTPTSDGIRITYGDELLVIYSHDGESIASTDLSDTDLLGGTRIPQVIEPGEPGPVTDPPPLPDRPVYDPPVIPDDPAETGIERLGTPEDDILNGSAFGDTLWGLSGKDTLSGADGRDILYGGTGKDRISGGDGDDLLLGGGGRDTGWLSMNDQSSDNADKLFGQDGDDRLWGAAGADRLSGGAGDDTLWGGSGRDTFVFTADRDRIVDFNPVVDLLLLDTDLWSGTRSAAQVVDDFAFLANGHAYLDFGDGDRLRIDNIDDLSVLPDRIDFI